MDGLVTNEQTIVIRRAQAEDSKEIWHILHANCRTWRTEQIFDHIDEMFVLIKGRKLLGVLLKRADSTKDFEWVEIHPRYPEILKDLMMQGLYGTIAANNKAEAGKRIAFDKDFVAG
jgi:hypothetical protein